MKYNITNLEAHEMIDNWAQNYYDKFGGDNDFHENCQATSTIDLLRKTLGQARTNDLIYVISLLLDANKYRTMDIMGICRELINDDVKFKELYEPKANI